MLDSIFHFYTLSICDHDLYKTKNLNELTFHSLVKTKASTLQRKGFIMQLYISISLLRIKQAS